MTRSSLIAACLASTSLTALAATANPAFNGDWKSNVANSPAPSETSTITKEGSGYHYAGSALTYSFTCDGTPFPLHFDNYSSTCKQSGSNTFYFTVSAGTVLEETTTTIISADGKTMTDVTVEHEAGGKDHHATTVHTRIAGNPDDGLVGIWRSTKRSVDPLTMHYTIHANRITITYPADKMVIEATLDGKPGTMTSPTMPAGVRESITLELPDRLHLVLMHDGDKPFIEIINTLSPDGKTLTSVSWFVGKEDEKTTTLFDKQAL